MPLVLWSGGCDSTHLLHTLLQEHKKLYDADDPNHMKAAVRTISIIHPQVSAQPEQQHARTNTRTALHKQGHTWQHLEVTITHTTPALKPPKPKKTDSALRGAITDADYHAQGAGDLGGLIQPLIWVPTAIIYLHTTEDLALGYIKGDDAQYYLTTIRSAFDNLQWVTGRTGKLITPLDNTTKPEIIHWLKHHNLYQHTWYCEAPRYPKKKSALGPHNLTNPSPNNDIEQPPKLGRPCKNCGPCMAHATALWQLDSGNCYQAKIIGTTKTTTTTHVPAHQHK